ncbi:hypothetical protein C4Q31_03470 [Leptospira borgpetersenii serovar Ceylonica]|nr:hypothetical protein C4Q31_03470 [Leptospira borgpetersenii serovar Ceylonica]
MICGNCHALLRTYEMIVLISFQVLGQVLNIRQSGYDILDSTESRRPDLGNKSISLPTITNPTITWI